MTNDTKLAEKLWAMRDHGRDPSGRVAMWGTNSRLDNLQAAFLNIRLRHFHEDVTRRREIAELYQNGLGDLKEMGLPPAPNSDGLNFDVYQNYECTAERRDELRPFLQGQGIGTLIQWSGVPIHHFKELGYGKEKFNDLYRTDEFFDSCLMLPMNMSLTNDDVDYIIENIRKFYASCNL